jgi:hypothetical protein
LAPPVGCGLILLFCLWHLRCQKPTTGGCSWLLLLAMAPPVGYGLWRLDLVVIGRGLWRLYLVVICYGTSGAIADNNKIISAVGYGGLGYAY